MATDQHDRLGGRGERQQAALVAEQDDTFLGRLLGDESMGGIVDRLRGGRGRIVVEAGFDDTGQHAPGHLVEAGLGDFALGQRLLERCAEVDFLV